MPDFTDAQRAEITYKVAAAKRKYELMRVSRPHLPVFDEAAAYGEASRAIVAESARRMVADAVTNDIERLRSEADGARVARKYVTANAWRS